MDDGTIIRLAQLATACVCIISGAAVAKAAVNAATGRIWQVAAGLALAVVFIYAAIELANRSIYFNG